MCVNHITYLSSTCVYFRDIALSLIVTTRNRIKSCC